MSIATKTPVTSSEAARAIVELARRQGIPGPPFDHLDWSMLAREVGWLVIPESEPGVSYSKETLAAEAEQQQLNERYGELHDKLVEAGRRAASRDEPIAERGDVIGYRRIPGDPAALEELHAMQEELEELEGKHAAVARSLTRLRARDENKYRLRETGLTGRVKAALT